MDDTFSSSRSPSPLHEYGGENYTFIAKANGFTDPSDIPRLRSQHSTIGYREGISAAKAGAVQEGFDEGYSLGAVMGLRIGYILGALQGLTTSLAHVQGEEGGEADRLATLHRRAQIELETERVFSRSFLGDDAVWTWDVQDRNGRKLNDTEDFTFEHVADSHPLIRKWTNVVEKEVKNLELNMHIYDDEALSH